jgi:hypothetical protein
MKKNLTLLFLLALSLIETLSYAQTPEGINYQAVIRKTNGALVANTTIAIRIQIKQNSSTGTVVYAERQSVITSAYGLVNFVIGQGTVLSGTFSAINWSTGNYWVSLAVDFVNGTNYLDYGSQRLMSAPYALYAKTAGVQLNQWRYGATAPAAALGNMGDFYLNTATGDVHYKSAASTWTLTGNIKGPQGTAGAIGATGPAGVAGPQGPAGATGATGLTGAAGPQGPAGATGAQGPIGLTGATGATGLTGATGPAGSNGTNGTAVLNGNTNPGAGVGVNGDFYINTSTNELFGPKTNGTWPAGVSLLGPQGPQGIQGLPGTNGAVGATGPAGAQGIQGIAGPQGLQGTTGATGLTGAAGVAGPQGVTGTNGINGTNGTAVLNGNTNPTAGTGVNGDFYINTATNELFGPKANGAWPAGINLIGPAGPAGNGVSPTYTIGYWPDLGGYVFRISSDGKHGLVCETIDQGTCEATFAQNLVSNPSNHSTAGAKFMDWRVPTLIELNEMYSQRLAIGNFQILWYWSSVALSGSSNYYWYQNFGSVIIANPNNQSYGQNNICSVRAVRSF